MCNSGLDVWLSDLNLDTLQTNQIGFPGGNSAGGTPGGGLPGGNPGNPGGPPGWSNPFPLRMEGEDPTEGGWRTESDWRPFQYSQFAREDDRFYGTNYPTNSGLETYYPWDEIPALNDKQLGVLLDYRFENHVRHLGYSKWTIANAFPSNSLVDRMARERLLAHIFDKKKVLVTAYKQLNLKNGDPQWNSVTITSFIINSLNRSTK